MMPTPTERRILQERRAAATGAVLVPILEELLEEEVIPEDEQDFRFLDMLMRVRAIPRSKGVFSPSMLGSCVRQAYLSKRGTEKQLTRNPQVNGYFFKGNFVHYQWQFATWKAHRKGMLELVAVPAESPEVDFYGNGTRPGVEVRVIDGEWGGTIDALVHIWSVFYVVDYKGINQIDFQRTLKRGAKQEYRKQIVGYASIANKVLTLPTPITDCLLVSENKSGPMAGNGSPIALHETRVSVEQFMPEVSRRLKTLRWYDGRDELPEAECVSTQHTGFMECPYGARFCRDEVLVAQKAREERGKKNHASKDWKVARPQR